MRLHLPVLLLAVLLAGPAAAAADAGADDGFRNTMDEVFGPGAWRQTSGYRTPAQEDALRRQGAGTVPAGRRSAHSAGDRRRPGAYDAVVPGMSQREAAARLRRAGKPFPRVLAEGAHGAQGAHLHIELAAGRRAGPALCDGYRGDPVRMRVVDGRRNPLIACEERWRAERRATAAPSEISGGILD
ncbi:hypothetical protein [Phenylobacterium soli]|nr:hypothetical protein [Phenylobacterium soli]